MVVTVHATRLRDDVGVLVMGVLVMVVRVVESVGGTISKLTVQ